jgi:hypothetical protein
VKRLVVEDRFKDGARCRIIMESIAIGREAGGGSLFGEVEKGKQAIIGLIVDAQIIEAAFSRRYPVRLKDVV